MQTIQKSVEQLTWWELLLQWTQGLPPSTLQVLAEAGALGWFGLTRSALLADIDAAQKLTDTEFDWIYAREMAARGWPLPSPPEAPTEKKAKEWAKLTALHAKMSADGHTPSQTLAEALTRAAKVKKEGGACSSAAKAAQMADQARMLENPIVLRQDAPHWIISREEALLGIALTSTRLEGCDTSQVNTTCKEFLGGKNGYIVLGVEIKDVRPTKTKNGKSPGSAMAHIAISDHTGYLPSAVVFPNEYREFGSLLVRGNAVILQGQRDRKGDSLLVQKIWQAVRADRV